jgi:hypothetical protein
MRRTHGDQIVIRILDPQSLFGFWRLLRHRIRRFPTFFVDGAERVVGWEGDPDAAVIRALGRRLSGATNEAPV